MTTYIRDPKTLKEGIEHLTLWLRSGRIELRFIYQYVVILLPRSIKHYF